MKEKKFILTLETIRRLIRRNARQNLKNLLARLHAADLAMIISELIPSEAEVVFGELMGDSQKAAVVAEMDHDAAVDFLIQMDTKLIAVILRAMAPDDAASLIDRFPEQQAEELRKSLSAKDMIKVEDLLAYEEETAGRIMTQEVFALPATLKVKDAIDRVRSADKAEMVFYVYVIDELRKLKGVVSLRKLLLVDGEVTLESIMLQDLISVTPDMDQEEVAHLVAHYNLLAIPVVDLEGILLGIITVDDIIDIIHEEATEDIYKLAGSSMTEVETNSPVKLAWIRFPWLLIRFSVCILASLVLLEFFTGLPQHVALFAILPLILSMIGGTGNQSATIVAERLTLRSDENPKVGSIVSEEFLTGFLLAVVYASLTYGLLLALRHPSHALMISLVLLLGMLLATLTGSLLPILYFKLKKDPVTVTGSLILGILDLVGLGLFASCQLLLR